MELIIFLFKLPGITSKVETLMSHSLRFMNTIWVNIEKEKGQ